MRIKIRYFAILSVSICASVLIAPAAAAAPPECTNVAPNTTQCETNGSSQIVTSPPANNNFWGWPYGGGFSISLGGWGW